MVAFFAFVKIGASFWTSSSGASDSTELLSESSAMVVRRWWWLEVTKSGVWRWTDFKRSVTLEAPLRAGAVTKREGRGACLDRQSNVLCHSLSMFYPHKACRASQAQPSLAFGGFWCSEDGPGAYLAIACVHGVSLECIGAQDPANSCTGRVSQAEPLEIALSMDIGVPTRFAAPVDGRYWFEVTRALRRVPALQ